MCHTLKLNGYDGENHVVHLEFTNPGSKTKEVFALVVRKKGDELAVLIAEDEGKVHRISVKQNTEGISIPCVCHKTEPGTRFGNLSGYRIRHDPARAKALAKHKQLEAAPS